TVWMDRRCHASHIDGIMLAKAKFVTFNENNIDEIIFKITDQPNKRHLILSEGCFSMDGTCSYWKKLIQLKQSNPERILLIIDDAHGIGALGSNGHGTLEQIGLNLQQIDPLIGTFGKAFGTHGGFICGRAKFIDYLQQSVRTQIYSTNIPPGIAAASRESLTIIKFSEGQILRKHLVENINYFKQLAHASGLNLTNHKTNQSPIQLLVYDNEQKVARIHNYLLGQNIFVGKIFYPTVPKEKPRLRISINIKHKKSDLKELVWCLSAAEKLL
ncbi:MAG TPA: pyridoxal phosphate-dependent aminotransferase family protein, partial [Aquella sp.]|nr:pyridoxal phosphate-dependent aminotransferase family protein [Aquella sp.]